MSSRLLVALAAFCVLTGCGGASPAGSSSAAGPSSAAGSSGEPPAEPAPAAAQASAEAAADPAAATDPRSAGLAVALRASDLPAGWTVQANPVPDGDLGDNPSLGGLCGGDFPSEAARTAKFPVVGLDPEGAPAVLSEAISYSASDAGTAALDELRTAFATCPAEDRTIVSPPPSVEGLAADAVVVEYVLPDGTHQWVIAQGRGAVVSVLLADDPDAAAGAARSIAGRLAALPAAAVGL